MADTLRNTALRSHMMVVEQRAWNPFIKKTSDPQSTQSQVLQQILATHSSTLFGKHHRFDLIRSYDEYQAAVPIHTYEELRPYIEAQEESKETRLTAEQPVSYAQTSGTTGLPKYIPILPSTIEALRRHQELSTYSQYHGVPPIFDGKILVLSSSAEEGALATGTSYGSMSGFLHAALPGVLREKDVLPPEVLEIKGYDKKYLAIALHVLAEENLSVIATANPSTVLKLLDVIRKHLSSIVQLLDSDDDNIGEAEIPRPRISPARLHLLNALMGQEDRLTLESFCPNLRALVTWMGGSCGVLMPNVKRVLPETAAIIEMGYLSSEFIGSLNVDVQHNRCVSTFHENFFEFVEEHEWEKEDRRVLRLDQIEEGKKYQVLVTTPNGLYRYFMNDIIQVTGFYNQTPTIQFVQKGKGVTNLTGEKLYEHQLMTAVEGVESRYDITLDFFLMLADPDELQYSLFIEHAPLDHPIQQELEAQLSALNIEFGAKRESGRLKPINVLYLEPGAAEAYKQHCIAHGQREAQFKVIKLQYVKDCSFDFRQYLRR